MPGKQGKNLDRTHQRKAGSRPRVRIPGPSDIVRDPNETLDAAVLRYQQARADTEQLDAAKRQLELDLARGKLLTIEEHVDQGQAAMQRVCQLLDLLPERLRGKLSPEQCPILSFLEDIIHQARIDVADGK